MQRYFDAKAGPADGSKTRENAAARGDSVWLWPVAIITLLEVVAAFVVRSATGYQDLPPFRGYAVLALVLPLGLAVVALVGWLARSFRRGEAHPTARLRMLGRSHRWRILTFFLGFQIVGVSMAAFTSLKSMLTYASPFWADPLFADLDRSMFGDDPWRITHALLGPATPVIDQMYGLWIPIKAAMMLALLAAPPSRLKAQAMISQAAMWALMGIVLAYAFSSAGPIFYDRITNEGRFADLHIGSELVAGRVSEYLWVELASGHIAFGSGISAMPSMHVAIAVWAAYILARFGRLPAAIGWLYIAMIFVGSVHLGWHYAVDGIVSGIGAVLVWKATGLYLSRRFVRRLDAGAQRIVVGQSAGG